MDEPVTSHTAASPVTGQTCRNCQAPLTGAYCASCGQQAVLHPPSVSEFIHEFITHHVALEGTLWRTLKLLLFYPGALTNEYLAGRRRRYIGPFRLYLTISFIFFLTVHDINNNVPLPTIGEASSAAVAKTGKIVVPDKDDKEMNDLKIDCEAGTAVCGWIERNVNPRIQAWKENPRAETQRIIVRARSDLPYVAMLMLPVFAMLTYLAYRSRRRYYGEHLVFAFHVHSFWFIIFAGGALLPRQVGDIFPIIAFAYASVAMQRVFHGRKWLTFLRSCFVHLAYSICLGFGAALFAVFLFLT